MKALTLEQVREHMDALYKQNEKDFARIERLRHFMSNGWDQEIHRLNEQISERYLVLNGLVLQEAKLEEK